MNEEKYQELKEEIERVSKSFCGGEAPQTDDMNEHGQFSHGAYVYHFDTWNNALQEFGFEVNVEKDRRYNLSKEELAEEIVSVCDEIGEPPTMEEFEKHSNLNRKRYIKKFDTWTDAIEYCGFKPRGRVDIPKKELQREFDRVVEKKGYLPTVNEYREMDTDISYSVYQRRFETWRDAVKEMGYEPHTVLSGEEHPRWKGGYKYYYGPSWWKQREKTLERDGYQCRICGIEQEIRNPDVHHITPVIEWDVEKEHRKMNSLSNLVSLCISCHSCFEGKWQDSSVNEFVEEAREEYND